MKSKLFESTQFMRELIDFLPISIFVKDRDGKFLFANSVCADMWGIDGPDLFGTNSTPPFTEDQLTLYSKQDQEVFAKGNLVDFENIFWNEKLKANRFGHTFKKPVYDENGDPLYMVCATIDITDARVAKQDLKLSEEKLRKLYEMAPMGIARNSMDGKFIEANQKFTEIVGYTVEELNKLTYWDFTPEKYKDQEAQQLSQLNTVGKYGPYKKEYIHKNGNAIPVKLSGVMIKDDNNQPYIWSYIEDISERVRLEEIKEEFISTVSHELRTPLTSIAGAVSLVNSGVLGEIPDAAREMLEIAHKNSLRLTKLINDLLQIDKLAAGKMELNLQIQPLHCLVEQAVDLNRAYGAKFDVVFNLIEPVDADLCANVDGDRIIQVLGNLLSNAAKFSRPGGSVDVSVSKTSQNKVRVDVVDHGLGIPTEFRAKIFQKFSQLDMTNTKKVGGSGLGLAICKELVGKMDGVINFESELGKGSDFYFEFPIASG